MMGLPQCSLHKPPSDMQKILQKSAQGKLVQAGVTLIELLVSMAIGLIILVAIGYVYLTTTQVIRSLESSARMQENVRYAFEVLTHDVRMAGFLGCASSQQTSVVNSGTLWYLNVFNRPVQGYAEGATPPTGVANVLRGDLLSVLQAENATEYIVESYDSSAGLFELTADHNLVSGQILLANDCSNSALFQLNGVATGRNVGLVAGATISPGNCQIALGGGGDCSAPVANSYNYLQGTRLYPLRAHTYYIRNNLDNEPSLYRQVLQADATTLAEEVIDGIENMSITYAVDTSGVADGRVDQYIAASDIDALVPGANANERWKRVLGIRVSLIAVSTAAQQVATAPQPITFDGAEIVPTDRRLRKVFTTTIAIRNRL